MVDGDATFAKIQRYGSVATVFTPGAPINQLALFAGRITQVLQVVSAVNERGRHVILYGQRGVGKTSLANVLGDFLDNVDAGSGQSIRVNCNTTDDFRSIWVKVLREMDAPYDGENGWTGEHPDPEDVRFALQRADSPPTVIILDELDRLEDDEALTLLADTVKSLSDHSVEITLLLVGVANSIDELVGEHRSIERALVQVRMPRMSLDELTEIMDKGLEQLDLTIHEDAKNKIARLSEGLPHYTHLLAKLAAERTVADDRDEINVSDVDHAIEEAVVTHSLLSDYQRAIRSPRVDNLYEQVMIACALAPKDELGYFTASAVRDPMSCIMERRFEIPAFARHLKRFSDPLQGVLVKEGDPRRYVYRFANPLLQPFAVMSGLSKGLISERVVAAFQPSQPSDSIGQQPLF